ncbi:MAG TPA: DNA-processing protein DprA [Solirubrobacterales bacterium]|nr:DNA-processing protein DprA [Solirubrobacterales bacterium]
MLLVFAGAQGIALDPADFDCFLARWPGRPGFAWLELRLGATPEERLHTEVAEAECWAVCRHDPLYPVGLRDTADAPWALFGRGDPELLRRLDPSGAVSVVGARRASSYGRDVARELGRELAAADLVVISGLAFGIDACAHRGAIEAGLTIAVLGCGADVAYPAAHRSLWRRIGESGLVVSELPPGSGAWRWTAAAACESQISAEA